MINGIILYLKSSNTGNWTSRWDVGVTFAGKVRFFFLFFCLKLGFRESVLVVCSSFIQEREFRASKREVQLFEFLQ